MSSATTHCYTRIVRASAATASRSIRIVCFDLGGVLVRICRSFEEATLASGMPLRRLPTDPATLERQRTLVDLHQRGELHAAAFHEALSAAIDRLYAPQEIAAIHAAVLQGEYPGVAELVGAIGATGLATACLSNTNDDHWAALLDLPALRALHARHASHMWGLAKPHEAIFRRFEREHGVAGRSVLYFDDLAENVEAALAVGWDAVLIDHAADPAAQIRAALGARGVAV